MLFPNPNRLLLFRNIAFVQQKATVGENSNLSRCCTYSCRVFDELQRQGMCLADSTKDLMS